MKTVEVHNNTLIGFICGLFGGSVKLITANAHDLPTLIYAAITAIICGACGVAGKELYQFFKKKIKR
jgi:hypothetical protein